MRTWDLSRVFFISTRRNSQQFKIRDIIVTSDLSESILAQMSQDEVDHRELTQFVSDGRVMLYHHRIRSWV